MDFKKCNNTITDTLLHHLEEYLSEELVEAFDKLSAIGKIEEFQQSVRVAGELRESIITNQVIISAEPSGKISSILKEEQIPLAQQLQSALSALQVMVLDHAEELAPVIGDQTLQRVAAVFTQLHEQIAGLQADFTNSENKHEIKELIKDDKSTIRTIQEDKSKAFDKSVTFKNEVALSKEQATETVVEPVTSLATKLENVIVLEAESHLNTVTKLEDEIKDSTMTDVEGKVETPITGNFILSYSFLFNLPHIVE